MKFKPMTSLFALSLLITPYCFADGEDHFELASLAQRKPITNPMEARTEFDAALRSVFAEVQTQIEGSAPEDKPSKWLKFFTQLGAPEGLNIPLLLPDEEVKAIKRKSKLESNLIDTVVTKLSLLQDQKLEEEAKAIQQEGLASASDRAVASPPRLTANVAESCVIPSGAEDDAEKAARSAAEMKTFTRLAFLEMRKSLIYTHRSELIALPLYWQLKRIKAEEEVERQGSFASMGSPVTEVSPAQQEPTEETVTFLNFTAGKGNYWGIFNNKETNKGQRAADWKAAALKAEPTTFSHGGLKDQVSRHIAQHGLSNMHRHDNIQARAWFARHAVEEGMASESQHATFALNNFERYVKSGVTSAYDMDPATVLTVLNLADSGDARALDLWKQASYYVK